MSRFFHLSKKAGFISPQLNKQTNLVSCLFFKNYPVLFQKSSFLAIKRCFIVCIALFASLIPSQGQIEFKVELLADSVTYQVSLRSAVTWGYPDNITSTAQVTLKAPTGGMGISNVNSLIPGTFWANNARFNSPPEAPDFDYLSFGLTSLGTSDIPYETGVETPLFTFVNDGVCTGAVELMLNDDEFYPPNSQNANVSNQLATFGAGAGNNAYDGPYDIGSANCLPTTAEDCPIELQLSQLEDGSYAVSMESAVTWNLPDNMTNTLSTTLVAPTGSLLPNDIISYQVDANFTLTNSWIAPATSPNFDYFVIELTDVGTTSLSYEEEVVVPLFSFKNNNSCAGDSLFLMDVENDVFANANGQNSVGQFIETMGSGEIVAACIQKKKAPIGLSIDAVNTFQLTDCQDNNASIVVEATADANLEFTIDEGVTWQSENFFSALAGGSYWVGIRYANDDCETYYDQNPVVIAIGESPSIDDVVVTQPTGCGLANGTIEITATSNDPLEYSIDGEDWQTSHIFNGLAAGNYTPSIRKTDLSCEKIGDMVLLESDEAGSPEIQEVNHSNVSPCDAMNGVINFVTDNPSNTEYSIDNGQTWADDPNFDNLAIGEYHLIARNTATNCATVYSENPVWILNDASCHTCVVEYELELSPDGWFQVSLIADTTWNFPQNITSTAQITIVVGTGTFIVSDLINLVPDVTFVNNSRINAPAENPAVDYISFGLETMGTSNIAYQTGLKVPLFRFRNSGSCSGDEVKLMRDEDPFAFPNSQSVNVGQQLTTIGSGQDAMVCIAGSGIVDCLPKVEAFDDLFNFNIYENPTYTDNVIQNDTNYLNNGLIAAYVNGSTTNHGMVDLQPDGTITYIPDAGFSGMDTLLYSICDEVYSGACDVAMVTFVVSSGNILIANDDSIATLINTPVTGQTQNNDLNLANNNLTYSLSVPPSNGTVSFNEDGSFSYEPNLNFIGTDEFIYEVCDDGLPQVCDFGQVIIMVNEPTSLYAVDDQYVETFNTVISENVGINDFDPNNGNLTFTVLSGSNVANGSLDFSANGDFEYTPNTNYFGIDEFVYQVCNDLVPAECDTAVVTLEVMVGILANDDQYQLDVNQTINEDVTTNDLMANGSMLTATILTSVNHGNLVLNSDGTFTYQPINGFSGLDMFTYTICDDNTPQNCDTATVQLLVNSNVTAVDDSFNLGVNEAIDGNVLLNDLVPTDVSVFVSLGNYPANGDLFLNPDGTFTYQPNPDFTDLDSFTYNLCDNGMPQMCDVATVYLNVSGGFMAIDDEFSLPSNTPFENTVLPNDIIPNGVSTTTTHIVNPHHGTLIIQGNGDFTYIPDNGFVGVDSFYYRLCDNNFPFPCDTAKVLLNVFSSMLIAVDDYIQTSVEVAATGNVTNNDENPINADLMATIVAGTGPSFGQIEFEEDGSYTYLPNPGFIGMDSIQYEVCTNTIPPQCDTASLYISVGENTNGSLQTPEIVCPAEVCGAAMMQFSISQYYSGNVISYAWINAMGTQIGNLSTLEIASDDPDAIQPFRVRVIVDGEQTDYSTACFVEQATVPVLTVTNSGPTICNGEEVQLLATSMPNLSYEWKKQGDPTIISTLPNPVIEVDGDATYELFVRRSDCSMATASYTTSIQVVAAPDADPAASYNMGVDCAPEPLTLAANATGNNLTYVWTSSNGFHSLQENPSLLNTDSGDNGIYTLTVTNDLGCSISKTVEVNNILDFIPEPIITYTGPVCMGEEVELITQYYAGFDVDYVWMKNDEIMASNSSNQLVVQPFSPVDTGMYRVVVQVDNCIHESDEFAIQILETPAIAPDFALTQPCEGGALTLNANISAGGQNATYQWSGPNGFTSNAQNPVISSTTISNNGSYVLTMIGENGCQRSESFDLDVITAIPAKPEAFSNGPICEESDVILTIQNLPMGDTVIYEWRNGNGVFVGDTESLTMGATDPLMVSPFSVKVTVDGCESDLSDPIVVEVENPATPALEINSDFLCEGESLLLNASLYNGQNTNYLWYFDDGTSVVPLSITTTATLFVEDVDATNTGMYYVVVQVNGCATDTSNIQQVNVFSQATPPVATNSSEVAAACFGEDVQLTVPLITGATYEWYGPAGFTSNLINPVLTDASNTQAGEYFAIINFNGCNITTTTTMVEIQEPIAKPFLQINDGQNEACIGGDLQFEITNPTLGATYEFYHLQTGERIDSTDNTTTLVNDITAAQAGQYYATSIVDGCPSPLSDVFEIMVREAPSNIAEAGNNQTLCSDFETLNLNAVVPADGVGQWSAENSGTVLNPSQPNSQVTNLEEGTNLFIWTLSTTACGEFSRDSVYVFTERIDVIDDDFAAFVNDTMPPVNLVANDLIGNPDEYTFNIVTLPSQGELMDLGDGLIAYVPFPGAFGEDQFDYMICSNTCEEICDIGTVRITLVGNNGGSYFVPNTITPNGDGINDAFVIPAAYQFEGSELAIFNRLGDEVFFADDYQNDWMGSYKNKPLPVGTYFYCIRLTDESKTVLRGYIVIKR